MKQIQSSKIQLSKEKILLNLVHKCVNKLKSFISPIVVNINKILKESFNTYVFIIMSI